MSQLVARSLDAQTSLAGLAGELSDGLLIASSDWFEDDPSSAMLGSRFGALGSEDLSPPGGTSASAGCGCFACDWLRSTLSYSKTDAIVKGPAELSLQPLAAQGGPVDGGPLFLGDAIGDTTGAATAIAVNSSTASLIDHTGDLDVFSVSLVAGQTYTISLEKTSWASALDCFLEIRNSAGVSLDTDDDGGIYINSQLTFTAGQTGTFYIVASAFNNQSVGDYVLTVNSLQTGNSSPTSFINNGKSQYSWDQAALQINRLFQTVDETNWPGDQASWAPRLGQPITITYAYRSSAPTTMPADTTGFTRFSAAQIAAAEAAFQAWAAVANITFVRVDQGDGYSNNAAILLANYNSGAEGAAAFAFQPLSGDSAVGSVQGDVWVNSSLASNADLGEGGQGAHALMHEIGHALGLSHPGDYNADPGANPQYSTHAEYFNDSRMFTVMTYFASTSTGGNISQFPSLPQLHDIAAIQRLYGANMSSRTGDTIYGFNSNTGVPEYSTTLASHGVVFAIWDGGGNDTLDLSGYATNSTIDLRQEAFSSAGPGQTGNAVYNISIARGVVIENAIGGSGNDTIFGNEVANVLTGNSGNDSISGNGGADTLIGGLGVDALNGGDGDDVVFWDAGDDLLNVLGGAGSDLIVFTSGAAPTTFNLNTHGFEGAEGRFIDAGGNPWSTRTDVYDALWRLDASSVLNDNGEREVTDYDQAGAVSWSSFWQRFDTLNRVVESVLTFDTGVTDTTDFDPGDTLFWSSFVTRRDTLGRTTETLLIHDSGVTDTTNIDADESVFWSSFVTRRDALGRQTESLLIHDNGTRDTTNFDADDSVFWESLVTRRDALGRQIESLLIHDDGTRDTTNFDADDVFFWSSFVTRRDALGRATESLLIHDDGIQDTTNFDPEDAVFWSSFATRRDDLGRTMETLLIHDDGALDATDYDETDAFDWASIARHYDPDGVLTQTVTTYDDGSIVIG